MTQQQRQVSDAPLPGSTGPDAWESVPEILKHNGLTREQWLWLSDGEKARLVQTETEPEA